MYIMGCAAKLAFFLLCSSLEWLAKSEPLDMGPEPAGGADDDLSVLLEADLEDGMRREARQPDTHRAQAQRLQQLRLFLC